MRLEEVSIEDVYPDENNPRSRFDGIEQLAASFDLNQERPGEPFTPPIVVADGGIFRIVDGERRYRALRLRGAKRMAVAVCEGMDEANAMAAMLATDDKQPLDDLERSRGVQQMLLLGVDPVVVEQAARIHGARRIRRAVARVKDAGQDMSLDRLLAIDELADDAEAVAELTDCSEDGWRAVYNRAKDRIERARMVKEMRELLDAHRVPVVADRPEGYAYLARLCSAKELARYLEVESIDDAKAVVNDSPHTESVTLYLPEALSPAGAADKERMREEADRMAQCCRAVAQEWREFASVAVLRPDERPHVAALCTDAALGHLSYQLSSFEEDEEAMAALRRPTPLSVAVGLGSLMPDCSYCATTLVSGLALDQWQRDSLRRQAVAASAAEEDGLRLSEAAMEWMCLADEALQEAE